MATTAGSGTRRGSTGAGVVRRLVIVESPAKAKKIAGYLGAGYVVESSIGHIRDLPRNAADVPASHKGQSWARLGVDVDNGFEPLYVVSPDKRDQVRKLKALLKDSDELLLATDEDREGEAIAWHLLEALKPTVPVRRMVFHEITPAAIQHAVENTRTLDENLVDAQETRRILDRLYGYEVSPVLWKKVMPRLSAGRVQSVATRVLVEREQARMAFRSGTYADLEATLLGGAGDDRAQFTATSVLVGGRRLATGRDFDADTGGLKDSSSDVLLLSSERATALAEGLGSSATVTVSSVEEKPYRRSPAAPFMTSTLQQEGGRKLRMSAQQVMRTAQRLYENGYITYMRTDSTTLSETALTAARSQVRDIYGGEYLPDSPRTYARKVKNAQEAHEAIRPSGDSFALPGQLRGELSGEEYRLYELIWQRTVASQMVDARGQSVSLRLATTVPVGPEQGTDVVLAASGRTITFPGFLRAYVESTDDEDEAESTDKRLPILAEGDVVDLVGVEPQTHSTQPPARFTEASLVKRLEELGIGRPSTYASIIETIQARGYVYKKGTALVPTWIAFAVIKLLTDHYTRLVDYQFTASMEDDLDHIANGDTARIEWLTRFYFGGAGGPADGIGASGGLKKMVTENLEAIDAREVNRVVLGLDDDGAEIAVRVGRYGPYLERVGPEGGDRANVPEDLPPGDLTIAMALELLATPQEGRTLGVDPVSGRDIVAKAGRFGPYVTEVLPEESTDKPRTGSLLKDMTLETITLDDALRLLSLPRTLGVLEGEEVTVQNGRYGPYVKKGTDSRSLTTEEQLFTVTLDEATALFAQPKARGRAAAAPPLKEFEPDPVSGEKVLLKEGRFGPYVTDGTVNASLRKGDDPETVTPERVYELLADKRAQGPAPKKARAKKAPAKKKATATKTPAKKTTTRTAAKKTTAKKAAAKKTGVGTTKKAAQVSESTSS